MDETAQALPDKATIQEAEKPKVSDNEDLSRLHKFVRLVKHTGQIAMVGAELSPLNEGIRFGAFGASMLATGGDPAIGAAVLGGTTFAVEGSGAVAAAGLMDSEKGSKIIDWLNKRSQKYISSDTKLSPIAEAGLAMTGGSAVVLAAKQVKNPSRTLKENRKHGLFTAGWMSAYFAAEGALGPEVFNRVVNSYDDPEKVGPALLAFAGILAVSRKAKERLKKEANWFMPEKVQGTVTDPNLTEEQARTSASQYDAFRNHHDESLKIGLYGEDLEKAMKDPDTTFLVCKDKGRKNEEMHLPLLVPAEKLDWYNMHLLKITYGEDTEFLYYAHPPIPEDDKSKEIVIKTIREKLDSGAIIITDNYKDQPNILEKLNKELGDDPNEIAYQTENLGGGELERGVEVFAGTVEFKDVSDSKTAPSVFDVYHQKIESGEFEANPQNGASLAEIIEKSDAERLWQIYKNPFDELGAEHPTLAGFSKEQFMDLMHDPEVVKIVNRVDGRISTLAMFVQDFDHCPWFNKDYYKENYPEYYDTENILIFPGIVSDENMRGHNYSMDVIKLATKMFAERGSNVLITFECTETSAQYVPKIVKTALETSGVAKVSTIDKPISMIEYTALRKAA